jgi:hypothetical protein
VGGYTAHCFPPNMGFIMIKKALKKITGISAMEKSAAETMQNLKDAEERLQQKINAAEEATKAAELAKAEAEETIIKAEQQQANYASPKDKSTANGEPWVGVIETHVNKDNIRNGFFELDWNELFITQLKQNGYGSSGDSDESIIDRWFKELCANVVMEDEYPSDISTGMLDIASVMKANK